MPATTFGTSPTGRAGITLAALRMRADCSREHLERTGCLDAPEILPAGSTRVLRTERHEHADIRQAVPAFRD